MLHLRKDIERCFTPLSILFIPVPLKCISTQCAKERKDNFDWLCSLLLPPPANPLLQATTSSCLINSLGTPNTVGSGVRLLLTFIKGFCFCFFCILLVYVGLDLEGKIEKMGDMPNDHSKNTPGQCFITLSKYNSYIASS